MSTLRRDLHTRLPASQHSRTKANMHTWTGCYLAWVAVDSPLVGFAITALEGDLLHVLADHLKAILLVVVVNHDHKELNHVS